MTERKTDELLLIDLSAIAHQIWHVSGNEPDPNFVSTQIIARVRALASDHPYAAVCCDNGKSFRAELDPTYKAQRDKENRAPLYHQMTLACETLKRDGFPIWSVKGFEADDIIASATVQALDIEDTTVLIATSDKDLLQLVGDRVFVKKLTDGSVMDKAAVLEKFKVSPSQMGDFLALVGDTSDNIAGARGIGGVIAARLLAEHGSLAHLYEKLAKGVVPGVTVTQRTSLMEFKARWPLVADLIALRTNVPIPFAEVAAERPAPPLADEPLGTDQMTGFIEEDAPQARQTPPEALPVTVQAETGPTAGTSAAPAEKVPVPVSPDVLTFRVTPLSEGTAAKAEVLEGILNHHRADIERKALQQALAPIDWTQQLEPRTMDDAKLLAKWMFDSRLFGAYGTIQAVLATILAGRELGMPAMASLRAFHIIEGKPTLSAGAIQSLVIKSGKAKYFRCIERTPERATFATKRGDDPEVTLSFTIEEARKAWPRDEASFQKSGWGRNAADMCVARASSKLARLVYPDVVSGLYSPEEFDV